MKVAIGGLVASFALGSLIRNIEEAESATAQLDSAFKATGANARVTRASLDDLASSIQRTTTYSDDLVKQAESILLTFRQVRGDAFERTIKVSTDLAARLGVDLVSAVRQVGRAINDPIQGLSLLRRSGIQFSESQTALIKKLVETGQAAQAQNLILTELEGRYRGAAAAARNTLSGSLAGLKNAFGDLFEGTKESTSGLVEAINGISETLSDPKVKEGLDILITGLAKIVELSIKAASGIGSLASQIKKTFTERLNAGSDPLTSLLLSGSDIGFKLGFDAVTEKKGGGVSGPTKRYSRKGRKPQAEPVSQLTEVSITARAIADEVPQFLRQMSDATQTEIERQVSAFHNLKETLVALRSEGLITRDQQEARLSEGLDDLLPEFDLEKIRGLKKEVKTEVTEMGEFMKGVWQGVGQSIHSTLSDAIYEWKFSFKSILDITRRALADILSAILISGIKKALTSQLSGGGSGSSGASSGFWMGLLKAVGFAAGGGSQKGPRIVGEDGPELDMGSGRIYNRRQLAFAGGGSNINFAPSYQFNIESRDAEETERKMAQYIETRLAQDKVEFVRTLQRSGVEVKG